MKEFMLKGDPSELLSARQLQIFKLYGFGWKPRAIAKELCRSPKTIEAHAKQARERLGLADVNQLRCVAAALNCIVHW